MQFDTELKYTSRQDKMKYVYDKYKDILQTSVLDVGADQCLLKNELPQTAVYTGIGLGCSCADLVKVDLEKEKIPFEDDSFDTVVCLDVLEHLDNIHAVFTDIFRVASKYVLISLPNPYWGFLDFLKNGKYMGRAKDMKFYGLIGEPESDRHKWFFSYSNAVDFVEYNAQRNNFRVIDFQYSETRLFKSRFKKILFKYLFNDKIKLQDFCCIDMWWVLENQL